MTPKIWPVGALCRAIADALDARFNPVALPVGIVISR
jgi:exodeoxyribonuclease VII large subunit